LFYINVVIGVVTVKPWRENILRLIPEITQKHYTSRAAGVFLALVDRIESFM